MNLLPKVTAEFLGSFAIVFFGAGAIVMNESCQCIDHVGISLAFGAVVMVMIYAVGHVSGAHFNPAVSLGFYLAKLLSGKDLIIYSLSQLAGAICGSLLLSVFSSDHFGMTIPHAGLLPAFIIEVVLTFFLMYVIISVAVDRKEMASFAGIVIGTTVFLGALIGGPVSGASMNPARSFGPALISGQLENLWLYFTAPALGAILAIGLRRILRSG
ncbi:MAG: aquaporin [Flavobacteriales bacterium]|nr:aquaporin [Flavobacteriales bacterium]